jgi:hypothetical protein
MNNEILHTAIYLRLSKEDRLGGEESNSIAHQRMLLEQYAAVHLQHAKLQEFCDDGYSGTNLRRPGMIALLEKAEHGKIDCILVKDFSRFSRDYIELGTYLEQIFPFLQVRFISVGDHYDSQENRGATAQLDAQFRSLLYDFYSKDLSVKVKSALLAKKERGEYACAQVPFGYRKDKADRHLLLVAEEEGEIVRRIFRLAAEGMSSLAIAALFNREHVKTPIEYKIRAGETKRTPKGETFCWSGQGVCRILANPFYTGDMIYGKYEQKAVGGQTHLTPKKTWKRYEDHHQGIISKELFDLVALGRGKARPKTCRIRHPLTGYVVCGDCYKNLRIREGMNPYFGCESKYVNEQIGCRQRINVKLAEELFLYFWEQEWHKWGNKEEQKKQLEQVTVEKEEVSNQKIEKLRIRLAQLETKLKEAYEKYVMSGRQETNYLKEREQSQAQLSAWRAELKAEEKRKAREQTREQTIEQAIEQAIEQDRDQVRRIRLSKVHGGINSLLTELFLEKMIFRENKRVEIHWHFHEGDVAIRQQKKKE